MGTSFNGVALKKFTHDGQKVKKWTHNGVKVWSGASVVNYYDGSTLIGTAEVDEGLDTLHPSFSTTKSGYTLYGWTTSANPNERSERISTLLATGEPISLYAIYVPNSLAVVSGGAFNGTSYSASVNGNYISGSTYIMASLWYHEGERFDSTNTFSINLHHYRNASVACTCKYGYGDSEQTYYDGVQVTGTFNRTHTSSGSHSLRGCGWGGAYYGAAGIAINTITLSNPIAWT